MVTPRFPENGIGSCMELRSACSEALSRAWLVFRDQVFGFSVSGLAKPLALRTCSAAVFGTRYLHSNIAEHQIFKFSYHRPRSTHLGFSR